jgi:hypothetical protein
MYFDYYEQLRNSSVHYSPLKEQIWHKPEDWLEKARTFSSLSLHVGLEFWKACSQNEPQYLGKLDYDKHYILAKERAMRIQEIELEFHKK